MSNEAENCDLYDIAILNLSTMAVSSIAARCVRKTSRPGQPSAEQMGRALKWALKPTMLPVLVPAGEVNKGDRIELPELTPPPIEITKRRYKHDGATTIERRQADLVCIICESPNLYNRMYCEEHAKRANR